MLDSLFVRTPRSQCFKDSATFEYCATKKATYYGLLGVVMINFEGAITGFTVVPTNVDEREALWDAVDSIYGLLHSPQLREFVDLSRGNIRNT